MAQWCGVGHEDMMRFRRESGGKGAILKMGEPGCGDEGNVPHPHTLIHYLLSFRFFNLVPSINFELSCLNHNPSSDSQRSAAEMDEWRDSSRRGHDRVRNGH